MESLLRANASLVWTAEVGQDVSRVPAAGVLVVTCQTQGCALYSYSSSTKLGQHARIHLLSPYMGQSLALLHTVLEAKPSLFLFSHIWIQNRERPSALLSSRASALLSTLDMRVLD